MLNAEAAALEHETRRELLEIRSQEVNQMVRFFHALGTQTALISGMVIAIFVETINGEFGPSETVVGQIAEAMTWISSALSLVCCLHCLMNATFTSVWGPGLALRGDRGSVSKAFFGMRMALGHINKAYIGSLLFFVVECVCAFALLEERETRGENLQWAPYASAAILMAGFGVSSYYYVNIKKMLYYGGGNDRRAAWELSKAERKRQRDFRKEDRTLFRRASFDDESGATESSPLVKSSHVTYGDTNGKSLLAHRPSLEYLTGAGTHEGWLERRRYGMWSRRYFVLQNSTLYWWRTKESSDASRAKNEDGPWDDSEGQLDLGGEFEIFVCRNENGPYELIIQLPRDSADRAADPDDKTSVASTIYGAASGSTRKKHYRTATEAERRGWVRVLVALSKAAQSLPPTLGNSASTVSV